jgi:hypothetical protein
MPDEMSPEISAVRGEIDRLRSSEAIKNVMHPSHEQALSTLSKLYAQEYPEPDADPVKPEEVEATKADANAVKVEALKVDDPEQAAIQEALAPLKSEWGTNYEANIEAAQGLVEHMTREMGVEVAAVFDTIGNSPLIVKNLFEWSQGRPGQDLSSAEAKEVIQLLQRTDAYKSGASRTSETVQQIVQALYQIAYQQEK